LCRLVDRGAFDEPRVLEDDWQESAVRRAVGDNSEIGALVAFDFDIASLPPTIATPDASPAVIEPGW